MSVLRLSRREWRWKDAEILILRHQPRAHSRLTWPDRAWLALLAGAVPAERLAAMRLIVTPATIVRWQRDMARRKWARRSRRGRSGRPVTHRKVRATASPGCHPSSWRWPGCSSRCPGAAQGWLLLDLWCTRGTAGLGVPITLSWALTWCVTRGLGRSG
jgi:hypothetical protein